MVDASRVVNGENLDVRLLVGTVVGGVVMTWWAMIVRTFTAAVERARELLLSPIDTGSALLEQLLMIPANSLDAANQSAAEFLMSISAIGPVIFPFGVVLALGTIWATRKVVELAEVL